MESSTASLRLDAPSYRQFKLVVASLMLVQGALWIATPLLLNGSIPLDVAEGAVLGPEWRLSYPIHPPFTVWLTGLAWMLGGFRYAAVDAIGFVLASGAFAAVAALVTKVDRPASGLVTLLIGFATPYATYVPIGLNHNIGLMPFWAAALAAGWYAFEGGSLFRWAVFGLVVGLGLWAKYAILHLIIPLAAVFFLVPRWRRQAFTLGPWLALLVCAAVVAPQAVDVVRNGSTTVQYATRTVDSTPFVRLLWIAEFALDCALAQASMAIIALVACGRAPLIAAIRAMMSPKSANHFDIFCNAAALGPILVILVAALFGVHPHYLWITAPSLSFALWWGRAAGHAGFIAAPRRAFAVFAALAAFCVVTYVGTREIAPRLGGKLQYVDSDGPALAALAQSYWSQHQAGPIPYIVTFGEQSGLQAGGSIVFDLPYRVRLLQDNDPANEPWTNLADLSRRGALIVSTRRLTPETWIRSAEIQDIQELKRPMARGATSDSIFFAILPPDSLRAAEPQGVASFTERSVHVRSADR